MEILQLGSTGSNVQLIQSILSHIGYQPGPVDGNFGPQTQQAVIEFQRDYGLVPDGIVGPATWSVFQKFIRGYDIYYIRPGDTLYSIARRYYTSLDAILTANPGINPYALRIGQRIVVPYGIDGVLTNVDYTYEIMEGDIQGLKAKYPFVETGSIGQSVLGKNLYYIKLGQGPNQVSYNGAHHANEWITSPLLMKFAENYAKAYSTGGYIRGYNITDMWNRSTIYIVPMVNPDGVDIAINGPSPQNPYYQQILQWNKTGRPFSEVWTANTRGVDLNLNYPAGWDQEKALEIQMGVTGPAPSDYGGPAPLSEPETTAMVNFTRAHNFRLVIAYHSQGRIIYYQYNNVTPPESLGIAQQFARVSGYTISTVPPEAAFAGYKDWFIQEYRRPGFTIEVGIGTNPVPLSQFNTIYDENEEILLLGAVV